MNYSDITPEMMAVIENWQADGAAICCKKLDRIEDALLDENNSEVDDSERLALIRELRELRKELSVFIPEGGGL